MVSAAGTTHAQSFTNIIDPLNPTFTQALGINDSDTIVGYGNATIFNGFTLTLPPVAASFARLNFPGADGGTQVIGISKDDEPTTVGFYIKGGVTNGFTNTGGKAGRSPRSMIPASATHCSALIRRATAAGYGRMTPPARPDS
jgi:hypothetical protein